MSSQLTVVRASYRLSQPSQYCEGLAILDANGNARVFINGADWRATPSELVWFFQLHPAQLHLPVTIPDP